MLFTSYAMAITVFTVYFLTLAVLIWTEIIRSTGGVLVLLIVGVVGTAAIAAAGKLSGR